MMKLHFLIALIIALPATFVLSQTGDEKRDHIWMFGYAEGLTNPPPMFGNAQLDFNFIPPDLFPTGGYANFSETNSSICDKDGNLLFYTNGIYIGRGNGQAMVNGNGISPGWFTEEYKDFGMIMPGGALILPIPESDDLYIVFHSLMDFLDGVGPYVSTWYYSIVDMNKQNGQGAVVEKNIEFLSDTLAVGNLAATKHGNGRDWWLLIPKFNSNIYYSYLLTPQGLQSPTLQAIGNPVEEGLGQAVFSPDGNKYARNELIGGFDTPDIFSIYDFDRCSGILSNHKSFIYADSAYSGGIAFSPNSRYLYVPHYRNLYQFDTYVPDILSSMDTIAVWDEENSPFGTLFYLASLGPDNKIYINTPAGSKYLHVIHQPDLQGDSCDVEQLGVNLPVWNSASLPTFPNFRLDKWESSPCDTIVPVGAVEHFSFSKILAYPNPTMDFVFFNTNDVQLAPSNIMLYNNFGKILIEKKWEQGKDEYKMNLSGLSNGIYFYSIYGEERLLKSGKLVVHR